MDNIQNENLIQADNEKLYMARPFVMMWWKFKKNKLAVVSLFVLFFIYLIAIFCEFVAPMDPAFISAEVVYMPPQRLRFSWQNKSFYINPYKPGYDPKTLLKIYEPDYEKDVYLGFLARGSSYKLWNVFESDLHLFGVKDKSENDFMHLFGTDRLGRDMLSRVIYGVRISTSIGLIGIFISFIVGILIGGLSGYLGGTVDLIVQRVIEFISCIPTIPLWMSLSAALPLHWPQMYVYMGIVLILSLVGWTGIARIVRNKFISLREEDFIKAARIAGAGKIRIIFVHMLPSFTSFLIASLTLSIPGMILGETSLSFIGLGLREPTISWGIILQDAQNLNSILLYPWLFIPVLILLITVLSFNFLGDGLRDAADPYSNE